MKCLIAKVLDDQLVLVTQEGEFRTVPTAFVRDHLPYPESEVTAGVLRSWTGRELDLPWPLPFEELETQPASRAPAASDPAGAARAPWRRLWRGWLSGVSAVAAAAAVLSFTLLPRVLNAQLAAVVAIDINPSLELQVDSAGRVIRGTPLNADAERLLASQPVRGLTLDQAVDRVIDQAVASGYLAPGKDNVVLAAVVPVKEGAAPDPAGLQREVAGRLRAAGLSGYVAVRQVAKEVREQGRQDRLSVNREVARQILSEKGIPYSADALRGQSIQQALKEAGLDLNEAFPGGERPERDAEGSDETQQKDRDGDSGSDPSESPEAPGVKGTEESRSDSAREGTPETATEEESDSRVEAPETMEAQEQPEPDEAPEGNEDRKPALESSEAPEALETPAAEEVPDVPEAPEPTGY